MIIGDISISPGNSKLGSSLPNISLIPVADCGNCEACKHSCYALRSWRMYPQVRAAWTRNSVAFNEDPVAAIRGVYKWFLKRRHNLPRFFRIHVAGDFISQKHVNAWCMLTDTFPEVKFLAFTKMYPTLDFSRVPDNFQVVYSMFPGMPSPPSDRPKAWVTKDKAGHMEIRVPDNAIECPSSCEVCSMCWHLLDLGRDVVFHLH